MVTTAPEYEGIINSAEFIEYTDICTKIQELEQQLIAAQTSVDFEAGFLPFDQVIL